jgi:hypothetical protein
VPSHDFYFALEISSQGVPAALVEDLAGQVFRYTHCAESAVPGLAAALEQAVATSVTGGDNRCDVQFRAHGGTLEVLVSSNAGRVWQTKLTIP